MTRPTAPALRLLPVLLTLTLALALTGTSARGEGPSARSETAQRSERGSLLRVELDDALTHYLRAAEDLSADRSTRLALHFAALKNALGEATRKLAARPHGHDGLEALLREAIQVLVREAASFRSGDLARVRAVFFALSRPLLRYVGRYRAAEGRYLTFHCTMARAAWLQSADQKEPANPYHGQKMLRCADRVRTRAEPAGLSR